MDNLEVIAIDHGWSQMKTVNHVFASGVEEILSEPAFFDDVLEYENRYYKVGTKRDAVMDNKISELSLKRNRGRDYDGRYFGSINILRFLRWDARGGDSPYCLWKEMNASIYE